MQDFHRLLTLYSDLSRQICESRREDWRWQTIFERNLTMHRTYAVLLCLFVVCLECFLPP